MSAEFSSIIRTLSPVDLGLDAAKFPAFRDIQYEAIEWAVEAMESVNVVGLGVPQGGGKTLIAAAIAKLTGRRTVFVTASRGLQSQYLNDLECSGLVDIRGRANYECGDIASMNCKDGARAGCRYASSTGCTYDVAKDIARNRQMVVTNYPMWMGVNAVRGSSGLSRKAREADVLGENPIGLVVFDEFHEAHRQLAAFVSCRLWESELKAAMKVKESSALKRPPGSEDVKEWSAWAAEVKNRVANAVEEAELMVVAAGKKVKREAVERLHKLEGLASKIEKIGSMSGSKGEDSTDWIVEKSIGGEFGRLWKFDSVFPGRYFNRYMRCGVEKVVGMSATLKPKSMHYCGLRGEEFRFRAWRRIFPAHRNPIYLVSPKKVGADGQSVSIRIDRNTSDEDKAAFVRWLDDEWIEPRLDRKGLIQTNSYAWQAFVMERSRFGHLMIGNTAEEDSESAWEAAERFRKAPPPALLVGPSFTTGWDFAMTACEFVLEIKVPFGERGTKLSKAREKRDPDYSSFIAMQTTEQAALRGMRREDDSCEVGLCDGHFEWFVWKNRHLAQDWFVAAVRKVDKVPRPLPKLVVKK